MTENPPLSRPLLRTCTTANLACARSVSARTGRERRHGWARACERLRLGAEHGTCWSPPAARRSADGAAEVSGTCIRARARTTSHPPPAAARGPGRRARLAHWVDASDSSPTSSDSLPATPPDVYAGTIPELRTKGHRGLGAFQVPPGEPSCDTWRLLDYELCVPFLRNESLRNESSHESSFTAVRSCTDLHAAPKCMHWSHDDASSTLPASRYWLAASWRP